MPERIPRRHLIRVVLLAVVLTSLVGVTTAYLDRDVTPPIERAAAERSAVGSGDPVAAPRENATVITGQGFAPRGGFSLTAIAPNGTVLYHESRHTGYPDVDPSPDADMTVLYIGSDDLENETCTESPKCIRDRVMQVNFTTGERELLYEYTAPRRINHRIHDADRIDEHRLLVAGLVHDRVYIVNTTTGKIVWEWHVDSAFDRDEIGPGGVDWTHMNDVEYLPDGRVMMSPRNLDMVLFVEPGKGLQEDWTLGADGDHAVLNEQHNPDYIPAERGGPAVLVADSQNNRVVEYQRRNGTWVQTWSYTDGRMSWPRDADRLPNGNTLITDSNARRVIEVSMNGTIVWQVNATWPYEAERLGTGDESAGGYAAVAYNESGVLRPEFVSGQGSAVPFVPVKLQNALLFIAPGWMGIVDVLLGLVTLSGLLAWGSFEVWSWRTPTRTNT